MVAFEILCVVMVVAIVITAIVAVAALLWMFWTEFIPDIVEDAKEYLSKDKEK